MDNFVFFKRWRATCFSLVSIFFLIPFCGWSQDNFDEYKGRVVDARDGDALVYASLAVDGTNISTITNTEGYFSLKIPSGSNASTVMVSFLGYQSKQVPLSNFTNENTVIELETSVTQLAEVDINFPKDAEALVRNVFKKKAENNLNDPTVMTAFYRETIRKRRKNASLTEAVVNIYKEPYVGNKKDEVQLYKSRKSTDYSKLDTIALKLMGGPFNNLYGDLIKYPETIFGEDEFNFYDFKFAQSTSINNRPMYVVSFRAKPEIVLPTYYGNLFIDVKTQALIRAEYQLNVENKQLASEFFVRKKPANTDVYPTLASYRVDYREKDGKWYYGYSSVNLEFKVSKRRKLFNSVYSLTSEMAITDWELNTTGKGLTLREKLRPTVVIVDEASGFSDPDFWGAYNVIEPEKSIESAIEKIKRQLERARKQGNGQ